MVPSVSAVSEKSVGFNRYYILDMGNSTIIEHFDNEVTFGRLFLQFFSLVSTLNAY